MISFRAPLHFCGRDLPSSHRRGVRTSCPSWHLAHAAMSPSRHPFWHPYPCIYASVRLAGARSTESVPDPRVRAASPSPILVSDLPVRVLNPHVGRRTPLSVSSFSPRSESKRIGGGKVLPRCVPRRSGHPVISVERILTTYMVQKYIPCIPRRKWYRNNTRRENQNRIYAQPANQYPQRSKVEDPPRAEVQVHVQVRGRTGGTPRPTHRVNQKSQRPGSATCGNDDVRHWRRPSERPSSRRPSVVAPRRARSDALRRTRAVNFPARGSMRGSGATHTGAGRP